jgi:hypothetical protein
MTSASGVMLANGKDEQEIFADTPSSPPAAAARTGWKSSARSTTSPTSPAPWTSACAWSVRNEVMEKVNKVLYESKLIGYPKPFKNKVRTFCQNPGGFVSQENYDNDLAVVNGHSYKELKSDNTNLAISAPTTSPSPSTSPSPTPRRWAS